MTLHCSLSLQGLQSPLYASCLEGNIEMVQLLVHHHAAINHMSDVSNALYNSTSISLFCCVLFTESLAYSVLLPRAHVQGGNYKVIDCVVVVVVVVVVVSQNRHISRSRYLSD